jgi:hypothetical protein
MLVAEQYAVTHAAAGPWTITKRELPSGKRRWKRNLPNAFNGVLNLSIDGEYLVASERLSGRTPDPLGRSIWMEQTTGQIYPSDESETRRNVFTPLSNARKAVFQLTESGALQLVDVSSGKVLLSYVQIHTDAELGSLEPWLATTPDGYYNGSPGVEKWLRWRVGEKLLPGEAMPERRRPDVIKAILDKYR